MDRTELINKMHQMQGVRLDVGKGSQTYILKDDAVKLVQGLRELAPRPEKVCIPHFVADYIKTCKEEDDILLCQAISRGCFGSVGYTIDTRVIRWFMTGGDACVERFARAWVNGYKVEEEPLYYALFKGCELTLDSYKNLGLYRGTRSPMYISYKHPLDNEFVIKMSKSQWNELGINDSNANFVKVEEIE